MTGMAQEQEETSQGIQDKFFWIFLAGRCSRASSLLSSVTA